MKRSAGKWSVVVALAWFVCAVAQAAEVRAWLDRNNMQLGESVTLNVEVSGDTHVAQPELNGLRQDFELLGTQSSTSVNMINGQTTSKVLWAIGLQPKHAGTLVIPALDIAGQQTKPLDLAVQPASPAGKSGDDVFIEIVADPRSPYVQQQIRFTVKMYFALNFSDGALDDPLADGLVVRRLGQDAYYAADVGGRRYRVWERRYALVPEKSGTLSLPPIAFRGHAIDPGDVNSFFSRGRAVSARSEAITFDVQPRPAASGTDAWLPAHALALTADGADAQTSAHVGEPLTLTLHLKGQGLGFEQLPELKLPKIDGADIYPDKAVTQNHDDGEWLYGERERKFAIVPNRPGTLTIPALNMGWWDTAHDRAETAELASLTLDVLPSAVSVSRSAAPAVEVGTGTASPKSASSVVSPDAASEAAMWRTFAFVAILLWVATLAAWTGWLLKQRTRSPVGQQPDRPETSTRAMRAACRAAIQAHDWPAASRSLLAWARSCGVPARTLGGLVAQISDPQQAAAFSALDRACYGVQPPSPDLAQQVDAALSKELALGTRNVDRREAVLPDLYPVNR